MATKELTAKPRSDAAECARLRAEVAKLEHEVEQLDNALLRLETLVLDGYAVAVWPVGDGTYLGTCPRLHASVQEDSREEAVRSLREAMEVSREGHAHFGDPVPPPDVQ